MGTYHRLATKARAFENTWSALVFSPADFFSRERTSARGIIPFEFFVASAILSVTAGMLVCLAVFAFSDHDIFLKAMARGSGAKLAAVVVYAFVGYLILTASFVLLSATACAAVFRLSGSKLHVRDVCSIMAYQSAFDPPAFVALLFIVLIVARPHVGMRTPDFPFAVETIVVCMIAFIAFRLMAATQSYHGLRAHGGIGGRTLTGAYSVGFVPAYAVLNGCATLLAFLFVSFLAGG